MALIAVDVVLLPPEEVMDKTIELNKKLVEKFGPHFPLNKTDFLPHISLVMGFLEEKNIPAVEKALQEITKGYEPLDLSLIDYNIARWCGGVYTEAVVEKTDKLQHLRKSIMNKIPHFFSEESSFDYFYPPPPKNEGTVEFVKTYSKQDFESLIPHISIGYGTPEELNVKFPINFTSSKLALCHLGISCTCRKILFSTELRGKDG